MRVAGLCFGAWAWLFGNSARAQLKARTLARDDRRPCTTLLEILDDKLIQIGVNTANFDAARHGRCAEILRSYTSDVATACHAHALQHGDKLIEEEVRRFVLGRESCSGPSPGLSCIAVQVRSH